jgi:integrase
MPRLTKKIPSYRLHRPSGRALVTLDGRDMYLGDFGTAESKAEYDRLIAEWLANGRRLATTGDGASSDLTVNELALAFWEHAERDYRRPDGTAAPDLDNLRLAIRPLREQFGSLPAGDFGPLKLQALQQHLAGSGLCRRTVNQRVKRIVRIFRWAESRELVPLGHHHSLQTVSSLKQGRSEARESKVIRPVPDAFVDAVMPFLPRQLRSIVELQRLTGMRSGEAVIMRTCNLDTSRRIWEYIPERHKTEHHARRRWIFLGPRAQEIVRPWPRPGLTEYLLQPREAEAERQAKRRRNRKTPLTPFQHARVRKANPQKAPRDRYDSRSYGHAIEKACRRAGVPKWHPHQLRHNAATRLRKEFGLSGSAKRF